MGLGGKLRRSHLYWHWLFYGLTLAFSYLILTKLQSFLAPLLGAWVLAYVLDPLVSWLEIHLKLKRWLATILVFFMLLIVVSALMLLVVPVLAREVEVFALAIPGYLERIRDTIVPWLQEHFKVTLPSTIDELFQTFGADLKSLASKMITPLGGMAGKVAGGAASLISSVGLLLLIPILSFYFLIHFPLIIHGIEDLIPRRYLHWVRETTLEIDHVLSSWIRGQLTVMGALAFLYSVGLSIAGIPMAIMIGVLTGLLAFIPYVGVALGFTLSLLVSILEYHGLGQIVGVMLVFGIMQVVEGFFLTPFLVGEKVGLGPLGVLLALMIGGSLFGFVGVLMAVPSAAALVVVFKRLILAYKTSFFYQKGPPSSSSANLSPESLDSPSTPP